MWRNKETLRKGNWSLKLCWRTAGDWNCNIFGDFRLFGLIDRPWVVPPDSSHFLPVLPAVTIYEMDEANIWKDVNSKRKDLDWLFHWGFQPKYIVDRTKYIGDETKYTQIHFSHWPFPKYFVYHYQKTICRQYFPIISARNTGKYCDFPVYLWGNAVSISVRKVEGKSFFGWVERGGRYLHHNRLRAPPPLSFSEDDTLLSLSSHEFRFGKFKMFLTMVTPEEWVKESFEQSLTQIFFVISPQLEQKGHNSEMWNRNFKRSNFLWNKFSWGWWKR